MIAEKKERRAFSKKVWSRKWREALASSSALCDAEALLKRAVEERGVEPRKQQDGQKPGEPPGGWRAGINGGMGWVDAGLFSAAHTTWNV